MKTSINDNITFGDLKASDNRGGSPRQGATKSVSHTIGTNGSKQAAPKVKANSQSKTSSPKTPGKGAGKGSGEAGHARGSHTKTSGFKSSGKNPTPSLAGKSPIPGDKC